MRNKFCRRMHSVSLSSFSRRELLFYPQKKVASERHLKVLPLFLAFTLLGKSMTYLMDKIQQGVTRYMHTSLSYFLDFESTFFNPCFPTWIYRWVGASFLQVRLGVSISAPVTSVQGIPSAQMNNCLVYRHTFFPMQLSCS